MQGLGRGCASVMQRSGALRSWQAHGRLQSYKLLFCFLLYEVLQQVQEVLSFPICH